MEKRLIILGLALTLIFAITINAQAATLKDLSDQNPESAITLIANCTGLEQDQAIAYVEKADELAKTNMIDNGITPLYSDYCYYLFYFAYYLLPWDLGLYILIFIWPLICL